MHEIGWNTMQKGVGLLRLLRPLNCVMMGIAVLVGAFLAATPTVSGSLWLGVLTAFTLTGASMTVNDIYDRGIDAINEPQRPLPSGVVTPQEALGLAVVLSSIGVFAAYLTCSLCPIVAGITLGISLAYSTKVKRTGLAGNPLVSACVVAPFIYGGVVVGHLGLSIGLFVLLVFLANTGREVAKGIVDVEGDRSQEVQTVAVRYGEARAAWVTALCYWAAVGCSLLPWLWGLVSAWFIPLVLLTSAGLVASSLLLLRSPDRETARKIKNLTLIWFLLGLLAFIAGTFP